MLDTKAENKWNLLKLWLFKNNSLVILLIHMSFDSSQNIESEGKDKEKDKDKEINLDEEADG